MPETSSRARPLPPLPKHLLGRPRDARGYPIPYGALIKPDGTPDFRIIDQEKSHAAATSRRCALCGKPMGRYVAFIGGPKSFASRHFVDGPMHTDCAQFAVQTCPHIVLPNAKYREAGKEAGPGVAVVHMPQIQKPDFFMVAVTSRYDEKVMQGALLYVAAPWESVTWWREGQQVPGPESDGITAPPAPKSGMP